MVGCSASCIARKLRKPASATGMFSLPRFTQAAPPSGTKSSSEIMLANSATAALTRAFSSGVICGTVSTWSAFTAAPAIGLAPIQ